MSVLVTGGTGYIGSHTALELLCAGHEVVLLDNYSNSSPDTLAALRDLAGREIPFRQAALARALTRGGHRQDAFPPTGRCHDGEDLP